MGLLLWLFGVFCSFFLNFIFQMLSLKSFFGFIPNTIQFFEFYIKRNRNLFKNENVKIFFNNILYVNYRNILISNLTNNFSVTRIYKNKKGEIIDKSYLMTDDKKNEILNKIITKISKKYIFTYKKEYML